MLLNFGAVDYSCAVWINRPEVGHNRGGPVPFQFDIAPYLREGRNRLTLRIEDRQDPRQPRGNGDRLVTRREKDEARSYSHRGFSPVGGPS